MVRNWEAELKTSLLVKTQPAPGELRKPKVRMATQQDQLEEDQTVMSDIAAPTKTQAPIQQTQRIGHRLTLEKRFDC